MSNLLEQASLVLIPSGYKEDVVYSEIPLDGSGDLQLTRASSGTRINSAGLVEVCPWNIAEQSESFDNVAWVKTTDGQVTITANATTAPNGTTTADKMIASAIAGFHCVAQTQSLVAGVFTISIYAKAGEYSFLQIFDSLTTDFANFNLTTGAVATVDQYTATIESVGNGWYRCTATKTNPSGNFVFRYGIVTTGTATRGESFTGNGVNGLFIWGAQLNIGSTAKPYFPTTDRLNVPRLTYQNGGGGCPSLLLEKQSTNKVTYSEQFDNADWTKLNATITANSVTSPDGTQNADTITDNTTNGVHVLYQIPSGQSVGTAWTCYMKKGSLNYGYISAVQSTTFFTTAIINLNDGSIVELQNGSSTTGAVTTEDCGNGWYRVKMQTNANGAGYAVGTSNGSALSGTYKEAIYTGTGSGTIYIWGAQLEDSSYPTSYIPTTSSSATRVADACYKTGISSLIGQTEGVVFWDIEVETLSATGNENILNLDAGSYGNTIYFIKGSTGILSAEVYVTGVAQCSFSLSLPSVGRYKMALAYKANDFAFYVNGVLRGTDSSGTVPATSRFQLGNGVFGPSDGKTNQCALFPTRLTNAELASLTTI